MRRAELLRRRAAEEGRSGMSMIGWECLEGTMTRVSVHGTHTAQEENERGR